MKLLPIIKDLLLDNSEVIQALVKSQLTVTVELDTQIPRDRVSNVIIGLKDSTVFTLRGAYALNLLARSSDDVLQAGVGKFVCKFEGIYILVEGRVERVGDSNGRAISLTVMKKDLVKLKDIIYRLAKIGSSEVSIHLNAQNDNWFDGGNVLPAQLKDLPRLVDKESYDAIDSVFSMVTDPGFVKRCNDEFSPAKHGLFLSGPPGTGKTSLIKHLAVKHGVDIYAPRLTAIALAALKENVAKGIPVVILLEDIDRNPYINGTASVSDGSYNSSPTNALMDALDGIPGLVTLFVVTANNPSLIPPAIIRQGRIDTRVRVSYLSEEDLCTHLGWDINGEFYTTFKEHYKDVDKLNAAIVTPLRRCKTVEDVINQVKAFTLVDEKDFT